MFFDCQQFFLKAERPLLYNINSVNMYIVVYARLSSAETHLIGKILIEAIMISLRSIDSYEIHKHYAIN